MEKGVVVRAISQYIKGCPAIHAECRVAGVLKVQKSYAKSSTRNYHYSQIEEHNERKANSAVCEQDPVDRGAHRGYPVMGRRFHHR